jgi:hypothetical protein
VTLRRYTDLRSTSGTRIPTDVRIRVLRRDDGCVGFERLPDDCLGSLDLDHVRASGGVSMKSVTCDCNLVSLCAGHHRYKTDHGKTVRPILLDYLATFAYTPHSAGHLRI